jgi:hypothetical protein
MWQELGTGLSRRSLIESAEVASEIRDIRIATIGSYLGRGYPAE